MPQALSLTYDDFCEIRRKQRTYIDKTGFVDALLDRGSKITLFCRPRRFGKSLFLSTIRYFVEASLEDRHDLFEGLQIASTPRMQSHFQKFPVITLDLKSVRGNSWEELRFGIAQAVSQEASRHRSLFSSPQLTVFEQELCQRLAAAEATPAELAWSLKTLSRLLQQHTGQPVYILVDEYDAPIHAAWLNGYFEPAVGFFRTFYGEALKGNPSLAQGVLTGVLKVAREGIFSSFNNPQVITVLEEEYDAAFGFTEVEVEQLRVWAGAEISMDTLKDWYNGYRIGSATLYNPWSILSCLKDRRNQPQPYWVETSSNEVLVELIRRAGSAVQDAILHWLAGESVACRYSDTLLLRKTRFDTDEVCTMLLHAGYFTPTRIDWEAGERLMQLQIPNRDVQAAFRRASIGWLSNYLAGLATVEQLCAATLKGDTERLEWLLSQVVREAVGQTDTVDNPKRGVYPEQFYHALVLGLLVALEGSHRVVSNRESGGGRPDVMIVPKKPGLAGVIFEFKKKQGSVESTVRQALEQVESGGYRSELEAVGAMPIFVYVVVFEAKKVIARRG
jgi:hypothetical protein